jgi:protein phosphatase PTC7
LARPLGELQSLRVSLLSEAPASAAEGWFLEEVHVRRSGGRSVRFPARRWLGAADASGAVFPLQLRLRAATASLAHPEPPPSPAARAVRLRVGAAAVPHPDKVKSGQRALITSTGGHAGEDAFFICSPPAGADSARPQQLVLGVCDGVYMWREKGIDAGLFSRALCAEASHAAARPSGGACSPLSLLQSAYRGVMARGVLGSCTACFALLDLQSGLLRTANLGDSGYLLMTPQRGARGHAAWQPGGVVYRSTTQEHEFGRPFQLGHHGGSDGPEDAMLATQRLQPGDVLLLGSDGLWDNLHDSEVAAIVQQAVAERQPAAAIARRVAAAAHEASTARKASTPYSLGATDAFDLVFAGGKKDDITVLVAAADET